MTDNYVMSTIAHLAGFPLAGLLLWRVETLKDLSIDSHAPASELPSEACPSEHPAMAPCEAKNPSTKGMASNIGQLLAKHCEETPSISPVRAPATMNTSTTFVSLTS